MARLAFFDLDGTLLAVNSGDLWIRREVRAGNITPVQAARAFLWLVQYRLGFVEGHEMVVQAVGSLKGTPSAPLRERTERFYHADVKQTFRPGGLDALRKHRLAGDTCVLLTSSTHYLPELVARDLELDGILCNTIEVDASGLHTGHVAGTICFGTGKRVHAEAEAARRGLSLADAVFYTDSYSDRSVMDVVGEPVAVNPDPRLSRLASQRRWTVVDWGRPGA